MSIVDYGDFKLKYNLIESYLEHTPMRITSKGDILEKNLFKLYYKLLDIFF